MLAEMEAYAREHDVPIVGPAVGTLLEILARSIGARRVFEMGSAIGYSTAFFARAVGRGGQVFYTDGSPDNAERARGYLDRMELSDRVVVRVADAVASLEATTGDFDVVFIDVDKDGYPAALKAAAPRVRRGAISSPTTFSGPARSWTRASTTPRPRASARSTARSSSLQEFRSVIVPLRDGVAIARREE